MQDVKSISEEKEAVRSTLMADALVDRVRILRTRVEKCLTPVLSPTMMESNSLSETHSYSDPVPGSCFSAPLFKEYENKFLAIDEDIDFIHRLLDALAV